MTRYRPAMREHYLKEKPVFNDIKSRLSAIHMSPFPENWELIEFFESEPQLGDPSPDSNWFYNTLTFTTVRGEDKIECVIEPEEYIFQLRWSRNGKEILSLDARTISGLAIEKSGGKETLIATSTMIACCL